jgi:hypothetical protein
VAFLITMVSRPPVAGEPGPTHEQPMRSAGITPGPAGLAASPSMTAAE